MDERSDPRSRKRETFHYCKNKQPNVHRSILDLVFVCFSRPNRLGPPPLLAAPHAPLDDPRRARDIKPRTTRIKARPRQIKMRRRLYRALYRRRRRIMVVSSIWRRRAPPGLPSVRRERRGCARRCAGSKAVRLCLCLCVIHLIRVYVVGVGVNVHLRAGTRGDLYMGAPAGEQRRRGC